MNIIRIRSVTIMMIQGFAVQSWMMYLGSGVDLMAQYSFSAIRSIATKCVEMDEVGKMLSLIYSVESIIPMFMTQVYASLWKATSSVPGIGETLWIGQYRSSDNTPPTSLSQARLTSCLPRSPSSHSCSRWWPGGGSGVRTSQTWAGSRGRPLTRTGGRTDFSLVRFLTQKNHLNYWIGYPYPLIVSSFGQGPKLYYSQTFVY